MRQELAKITSEVIATRKQVAEQAARITYTKEHSIGVALATKLLPMIPDILRNAAYSGFGYVDFFLGHTGQVVRHNAFEATIASILPIGGDFGECTYRNYETFRYFTIRWAEGELVQYPLGASPPVEHGGSFDVSSLVSKLDLQ